MIILKIIIGIILILFIAYVLVRMEEYEADIGFWIKAIGAVVLMCVGGYFVGDIFLHMIW